MSARLSQLIYVVLVLLVLLAPIPLGSNREWSWSASAFLAGGLGICWLVSGFSRSAVLNSRLHPAVPALFGLALIWIVFQFSTWSPAGWHHPLWSMTGSTLGEQLPGNISLAPEAGWTALMRLMTYALVFLLALQLGRKEKYARAVFGALTLGGLAYVVFGLVSYWGGYHAAWLFGEQTMPHDVRSTFINRNHFATWLGITIVCAVAYFYQRMARPEVKPYAVPRGKADRFEEFILKAWKPMIAVLLMVTALVLTHSRGGFVSMVAGLLVFMWLLDRRMSRRRDSHSRKFSWLIGGTAMFVASTAFFLSSEVLLDRINRTDISTEERFAVYANINRAIGDNPVLGFGYGTFADSFRLYDQNEAPVHYDRAHNTWLENAFELGIPAAILLFAALLGITLTCWRGVHRRHRDWVYPAAGVGVSVLVGVHALVDFSLQIPAVAMLYALVMGVACAQSYSSIGHTGGNARGQR